MAKKTTAAPTAPAGANAGGQEGTAGKTKKG